MRFPLRSRATIPGYSGQFADAPPGERATDVDPVAHRVEGVDGGAGPAIDGEARVERAVVGLALVELEGGEAPDGVAVHVVDPSADVEPLAVGRHRQGFDRAGRRVLRVEA